MRSSPRLADQVSGTGELKLSLTFENARTNNVHVYIDGDYVGRFAPPLNSSFMTYTLPAGRRTIRVEAVYEGKKAFYEKTILILGDGTRQNIEAALSLQ